jgi:formylglycine-generating enzyme required for sulfatase activity
LLLTALTELIEVPGGIFMMGADRFYADEGPMHVERVNGFAIERHPVTNMQFASFVADTDYVAVSEWAPDPTFYPSVAEDDLQPAVVASFGVCVDVAVVVVGAEVVEVGCRGPHPWQARSPTGRKVLSNGNLVGGPSSSATEQPMSRSTRGPFATVQCQGGKASEGGPDVDIGQDRGSAPTSDV